MDGVYSAGVTIQKTVNGKRFTVVPQSIQCLNFVLRKVEILSVPYKVILTLRKGSILFEKEKKKGKKKESKNPSGTE